MTAAEADHLGRKNVMLDTSHTKSRASSNQFSVWRWPYNLVIAGIVCVYLHWLVLAYQFSRQVEAKPNSVRGLKDGWIGGMKRDAFDGQWRDFRNNLPLIVVGGFVFCIVSQVIKRLCESGAKRDELQSMQTVRPRLVFYALASFGFLAFIHGSSIIFMIGIALCNFFLSSSVFGSCVPALTWVFNLVVLYCNESYRGYRWSSILGATPLAATLDANRGLFPWHFVFNLTMLRLVSVNLERHWARQTRHNKHRQFYKFGPGSDAAQSYSHRVQTEPCADSFSLLAYLTYCFYVPLQLAGPTIPFTAWISQVRNTQRTFHTRHIVRYALRYLACLLLLELHTHLFYFEAINHSAVWWNWPARLVLPLNELHLSFIWLKFVLIWRLFRLWALVDGVETVENMPRCYANTNSIRDFWRSWHASFNRWLLRYVYVPLGGSRGVSAWRRAVNVVVVFVFVAVWHDITFKLLSWGLVMGLFITPEILGSALMSTPIMRAWSRRHPVAQELLGAFGSALLMDVLVVGNTIGFGSGLDGAWRVIEIGTSSWDGIAALALSHIVHTGIALVVGQLRRAERASNQSAQ